MRFLKVVSIRLRMECQMLRRCYVSSALFVGFQYGQHRRCVNVGRPRSRGVEDDKLDALFVCVVVMARRANLISQIAFDERIWR